MLQVLASNNEMVLLPVNEPTFGTKRWGGGGGRGQLARWAPTLHARTASLRTHSPTLPLNPHAARSKSQIQTYLEQNEGPGLQHLALKTDNVFRTVRAMRERWVGSWVGC